MKRMKVILATAMLVKFIVDPSCAIAQDQSFRFAPGSNLMLLGDSFTNDFGFDWAVKVRDSPDFDFDMQYFSQSGRTLATMDQLFLSQYSPNLFDAVVVAGGVNDVVQNRTFSQMQGSATSIIGKTNGEHIILTTIAPFRGRPSIWSQNRQDTADEYDNWVRSQATTNPNISVFDIRHVLDQNNDQIIDAEFASADNFHPQNCAPGLECGMSHIADQFIAQFSEASALVLGDFDGNLVVDGDDVNAYLGKTGFAADGSFAELDLIADGIIDHADVAFLVENLVETENGQVGTFLGDVNFDGAVDILGDAIILVAQLGNAVDGYDQGDIDLSGTVDVLGDAFILISNLGESNAL